MLFGLNQRFERALIKRLTEKISRWLRGRRRRVNRDINRLGRLKTRQKRTRRDSWSGGRRDCDHLFIVVIFIVFHIFFYVVVEETRIFLAHKASRRRNRPQFESRRFSTFWSSIRIRIDSFQQVNKLLLPFSMFEWRFFINSLFSSY